VFRSPNHAGAVNFIGILCTAACGFAMMFAVTGCGRRTSARIPAPPKIDATETGIASWYGEPYNGRRAASGEIYDMEKLTAAHRTLAFGTWLEVTDLDNGKQVEVRVIDRGPFVRGRIIDLSLAAARKIDMVGPGTARVQLKVIPAPQSESPSKEPTVELYSVQAGAFSTRARADSLEASLREQFEDSRVVEASTVWRVLVGRGMSLDSAKRLAEKVREAIGDARVVPDR
jgi:rare lipoprotein A